MQPENGVGWGVGNLHRDELAAHLKAPIESWEMTVENSTNRTGATKNIRNCFFMAIQLDGF
jgi:hypothetical protein